MEPVRVRQWYVLLAALRVCESCMLATKGFTFDIIRPDFFITNVSNILMDPYSEKHG